VDGCDVRVVQRGDRLSFPLESQAAFRVRRPVLAEHFDRESGRRDGSSFGGAHCNKD
jgi:hypothetical protein